MSDNKKSSISKRSTCYLLNLKQPDKTARRLKLSFQRTAATVTVLKADRTVEASVGFLDVSETGAGVFTPELLHKGSVVELCITEPTIMKVRGIVAWSIPVTSGIHAGRFKCRSGIQFVFDGESQRQALQDFVRRAGQDPIENIRNASAMAAIVPETAVSPVEAAPPATDSVPAADTPVAVAPTEAAIPPASEAVPAAEAAPPVEAAAVDVVATPAPVPEAVPAAAAAEAVPASAEIPSGESGDSGQQAA